MFEFGVPLTSKERFWWRLKMGKKNRVSFWRLKYAFYWWLHNVPIHILIGFFPITPFFKLHDWSSDKLHGWRK